MKRITAVIATLLIGFLLTYTVIGMATQSPTAPTSSTYSEAFNKQIGGNVYAVAKQGNYAYIGIGKSLAVLDVQNPASPQLVGQTNQLSHEVYALTLSGTIGFAPKPYGLRVFDLSDPTNPQLVNTYDLPGYYVNDVVIYGTYAFVTESRVFDGDTAGGLRILDISDPLNINQAAIFGEGNGVDDIAIHNNYAYLAYQKYSGTGSFSRQLMIVDISTVSSPTEVYSDNNDVEDVALYGNYLYVSDGNILEIYDISTPDSPTYLHKYINNINDYEVFVFGNKLFITDYRFGVDIYDLTDPSNTSSIGSYQTTDIYVPIGNVVVEGDTVYLAYYAAGLRIIDIDPTVSETSRYNFIGYPVDVLNVNGYTYLLNLYQDLYVLDTSDPLNPVEKATYAHIPRFTSMQLINQNLLLVGLYEFDILDVTHPLNPTYVSHHYTIETIRKAIIHGDFVYLGMTDDSINSVEVVRIADTTHPTKTASIGTTGHVFGGGKIVGDYFFLNEAAWTSSADPFFHVVDISNPFSPEIKKTLTFTGDLESLAIIGNYAYLANQAVGIQIVNISNPLNPVVENVYKIPDSSTYEYWVKAVDGQLFAASELVDGSFAQDILDVTNPTSPVKVGEFAHYKPEFQQYTEGIEVNGYLYYPTTRDGLLIYDCFDCVGGKSRLFLPLVTQN